MIIGITGTLGAGKGTVAEYLTKKHNFTYLSVRNFLAGEVVRRGLMVNRDTITQIANDLRAAHGPGWVVEQILNQALSQAKTLRQKDIVIESIRSIGEAQMLKAKGAILWGVDADPKVRYNRVIKRDQGSKLSLEQFASVDAEDAELHKLIAEADVKLLSDGTKEEFFGTVEKALITCGYGA